MSCLRSYLKISFLSLVLILSQFKASWCADMRWNIAPLFYWQNSQKYVLVHCTFYIEKGWFIPEKCLWLPLLTFSYIACNPSGVVQMVVHIRKATAVTFSTSCSRTVEQLRILLIMSAFCWPALSNLHEIMLSAALMVFFFSTKHKNVTNNGLQYSNIVLINSLS